jgi:putative hydrolase of HD superfamily
LILEVEIMKETEDIIDLIRYGITLKRVNRTGWGLAGVDCIRTESVAEHTYGSVLTSVVVTQYLVEAGVRIDVEKVLKMATIHDIQESLTSDIPRTSDLSATSTFNDLKRKLEREAIQKIFNTETSMSKYFLQLWEEYEQNSTFEAKIVRGSDIIDLLMHALALEDTGVSPRILNQFFITSRTIIESLEIDILNEIFLFLQRRHQQNTKATDGSNTI